VIETLRLQEAVDRTFKGDRLPSLPSNTPMSAAIARAMTVKEAGRALFAADLHSRDPTLIDAVEKVSIVRRGVSATRTTYVRTADENYLFVTRKQLLLQLRLALAGAAAMEVAACELTTLVMDDYSNARVRPACSAL
jgi:ATP-dependent Zn protease